MVDAADLRCVVGCRSAVGIRRRHHLKLDVVRIAEDQDVSVCLVGDRRLHNAKGVEVASPGVDLRSVGGGKRNVIESDAELIEAVTGDRCRIGGLSVGSVEVECR